MRPDSEPSETTDRPIERACSVFALRRRRSDVSRQRLLMRTLQVHVREQAGDAAFATEPALLEARRTGCRDRTG